MQYMTHFVISSRVHEIRLCHSYFQEQYCQKPIATEIEDIGQVHDYATSKMYAQAKFG